MVPAFNEQVLLPGCLDALLAQDYRGPVEIIVVDNASSDDTGAVARARSVRVVSEPQRGYCSALRRGFAAATGDVIACTDADSIVPEDWISRLVREYEQHPDVVAVGGDIQYIDQHWKSRLLTGFVIPLVNRIDRANPKGAHMWGANLSVRRNAFLAAGGWNPEFGLQADSELSERMRGQGRVVILESLRVRTSSRRWNKALLYNSFLFATNFVWFKLFHGPLYREFPAVRAVPAGGGAAPGSPRWRAIALAAIMLAGLGGAVYSALEPRSNTFGHTYWSVPTHDKVVALTFDDGPNEPYTSQVLDILGREHVPATFFLIGANTRLYPRAAARETREGHVVGNHSDTHPVGFALESVEALRRELSAAENSIHAATGEYPHLFRPPQGLRSPWLMSTLARDSLIAVTWNDTPHDWDPLPSAELVHRALEQVHPGSIILLHDGMNLTHGANQSETVKALPVIIHRLRSLGYRFCTVPELVGQPAYLAHWPMSR